MNEIIKVIKELIEELSLMESDELSGFKSKWLEELERMGFDSATIDICSRIVDQVIQDKENIAEGLRVTLTN